MANPFTDADETKLDGIATGAEVNVQADWDETDTSADSYIDNKPTLAGRFMGSWAARTAYSMGDVVFSTGQFWRAKQDVADNRTGAPTNDLDYWQQSTFSVGIASSLPVFTDNDEYDLNRDRWIILTADQTITGTRDGTGALPYVADLQDSRSTSEIQSNQLTSLNRGDILRADTWPTRYWARMIKASSGLPGSPTAQNSDRNYNLRVTSAGVVSWQQDTGGGTSAGEENVQSDWTETDTASDSFILNKPTLVTAFTGLSDTPASLGTAGQVVQVNTGATGLEFADPSTGGLATVSTDATITGDGSSGSPLSVANPFTDDDETKLDGIAAGAEVNVQSDWNATSGDAFIANKPTIPTVPGNATDTTAGLMSGLDKAKLDSIATGAERNVQADWNTTNTTNDSYIQNKPTIPDIPGAPSAAAAVRDYNLRVATDGTATWQQDTGGGPSSGEENVQADWNETDTADDAFIRNKPTIPTVPGDATTTTAGLMSSSDKTKLDGVASGAEVNVQSDWNATSGDAQILNKPTIPTLPTDSQIGDKAFSNPPTDLDDAEKANVRTNIGLTNSNIGVLAFRNPPGNLTTTQQTAVRTAIGAGTGGGGGSTSFAGLSDTPAALGSAGQFIRVNSAGTALEFVAAPGGGGGTMPSGNQYLPPPDERSTDGGFFYMGWEDDFASSWGIRRVSLSTGAATTATMTNNSVYATLTAAWPQRTSLTYA